MYAVRADNEAKVFGCSSLAAVVKYISEIGVECVTLKTNAHNRLEACIDLVNGEYVNVPLSCPTSAHDWIMKHVPGEIAEILSRDGSCEYRYK